MSRAFSIAFGLLLGIAGFVMTLAAFVESLPGLYIAQGPIVVVVLVLFFVLNIVLGVTLALQVVKQAIEDIE